MFSTISILSYSFTFLVQEKQKMTENRKPKLLDQVRHFIRIKHYSLRTEESYVNWIKRFFFHDKKHPNEMVEEENRSIHYLSCKE